MTSHVIEFASQLFIVDAQYTLPFARGVARHARSLGKPLTRVYATALPSRPFAWGGRVQCPALRNPPEKGQLRRITLLPVALMFIPAYRSRGMNSDSPSIVQIPDIYCRKGVNM